MNLETLSQPKSSFEARFISSPKKLEKVVEKLRKSGLKVVLTQGTYDMIHIGHARYLESAKNYGDVLIVGVDSDKKVKQRKGPDRPVVPESERLEMLSHIRAVDIIFLKKHNHPKWHLIKTVRPDVLIATKETYNKKQLRDLKSHCEEVVVLSPQATTSTSAKIRLLQIGAAKKIEENLTPRIISSIKEVLEDFRLTGGK